MEEEALGRFFDFIWSDTEGWIYLPSKLKDGTWKKSMLQWPKHKEHAISHVVKMTATESDVFFAPAIFKSPQPTHENVLGSWVIWADFDGSGPTEWTPDTVGEAVPMPSLRIQTSVEDHQHVYWRLSEFAEGTVFEEKNRAIAYTLGADTSGWDANQILRPPYTTNYKHDLPVIIAEETEHVYQWSKFESLKSAKQLVTEKLSLDSLVSIESILANYTWPSNIYENFMTDEFPIGIRSAKLMELGYFGAEQGMTDQEILSILVHADDRWDKFKKRPDRLKRLSDIINRARQKHPTAVGTETFKGLLDTKDVETDVRYAYGFEEFINSEFKIEWLVDNLISTTGVGLLTAAGGTGKTQLSSQLGMHIALGKPYLRYTPVGRAKVGFFSLEMARAPIKHFYSQMAKGYEPEELQLLDRNFIVFPLGERIPLDKPVGKTWFEQQIEEYGLQLLIIDSFGKILRGKLTDDEVVRDTFAYLHSVCHKYKCAILIIHHNRKAHEGNKKPREQEDVYGSAYITNEPDYVLNLWREKGIRDELEVSELKNRLAGEREPFKIQRIEHLNFKYDGEIEPSTFLEKQVNDASPESDGPFGI